MKKSIIIILVILLTLGITACTGNRKEEASPEPTKEPVITNSPEPSQTPEPEPDPDEDEDAVLYRFAYEQEDILDTMFDSEPINPINADISFTDQGLELTVKDIADPYFYLPMPNSVLDISKYPILKMRIQNSEMVEEGEFYIGFDGEEIAGDDQNYNFDIEVTDDWQDVYLDLRDLKPEANTITTFRADLLAGPPISTIIVLDYIGFFPSLEAAEAYTPPNLR